MSEESKPSRLPYLNCPFCPSQALPEGWVDPFQIRYKCHANHIFYIAKENQ